MSFTTLPGAGSRLYASTLSSLITELRPTYVRKSADETIISNATLQNDDELFVSVAASTTYDFELMLIISSGTTPDWKGGWTYPSGLTMNYSVHITEPGATNANINGPYTEASVLAFGTSGSNQVLRAQGNIVVSTTAGTLQLQWAQNTLTASNTIVRAGSHLSLEKKV